ncbi:MAG: oligoribonuclease [Burkholderiales bacterium]
MSGLDPDNDRILEVAMVITDQNLVVVAEGPVLVVHQSDAVLNAMDSWNKATHARTGLVGRVKASPASEQAVENDMIAFLKQYLAAGVSPMCGNSVCQDRRFLARYMPALQSYFHYRNLDVSTLKELAKRWKPQIMAGFQKQGKHEALADIYESIDELKYYREHFLSVQQA